jgi:hypothetical protein
MLQLVDTQKCALGVGTPVDAKGAPAKVQDGSVVWTSSDPTVVAVTQDAQDQLKAVIVAGLPGTAQVNVSGDADLGDAVKKISAPPLDVTVVAGAAVAFGAISTGTPEEQ